MKKGIIGALCALALTLAVSATSWAVQYNLIDLGEGRALSINNHGQVIGQTYIGGVARSYLWENGVFTDLGACRALSINNHGQVVGDYMVSGEMHAFLWQNGVMTDLGTGRASDINDNGLIVGSYNYNTACVWQNNVRSNLPKPGPGGGFAHAVNNNGQVVGEAQTPYYHAALWQNGTMTDLGILGGNQGSNACGINDKGQIVGSASANYMYSHAFLWQNGVMQDLGSLAEYSVANDINESSLIAGYSRVGGSYYAVTWQNGVMTNISGGVASEAYGLNDNGWICGVSNSHAVIWQPIVPEPSSMFTLFAGLTTLGGFAIRRRIR